MLQIHKAYITKMNLQKMQVDMHYPGCKSWPAYLATDDNGGKLQTERKHVIVVELPAEMISRIRGDKPKPIRHIELVFRCRKDSSIEFANCIYKTSDSKLNDEATEKKIIATIRKYSNVLHAKYSKLSEIRLSKVKSSGFGTERAIIDEKYCIALIVPYKGLIPIFEEPFPPTINGYPTDVWEGEVLPSYHPASHQVLHPLRMGSSFGIIPHLGQEKLLTIGPFIKHNNSTCILSVGHGTVNNINTDIDLNTPIADTPCSQPMFQIANRFGIVVRRVLHFQNFEDAALIEIVDANMEPLGGYFPDTRDSFDSKYLDKSSYNRTHYETVI